MRFRDSVTRTFSAAHALKGYRGKCENLHGHTWKVRVSVESSRLDTIGMAMDFSHLKSLLDEILSKLDHRYLNETPPFDTMNPSAEHIALYIFEKLRKHLKRPIVLKEVEVWESENSSATVSR